MLHLLPLNEKLKTRVCHRLYTSGKEFNLALFIFFFLEINLTLRLKGLSRHNLVILFCGPINWFLSLSISTSNQPNIGTNAAINCFSHWKKGSTSKMLWKNEFFRRRLLVQHSSSFWVRSTETYKEFWYMAAKAVISNHFRRIWRSLNTWASSFFKLVFVNEGMNKDKHLRCLNCW